MDENMEIEVNEEHDEFDEVDLSEFLLDEGEEAADQPRADQPPSEPEEGAEEKPAEGQTPAEPEPPETFKLKYMDRERDVSREEVISLAQQGMDYQRVREQRESLAARVEELQKSRDESAEAVEFVAELARESGKTVPDVIDMIRANRYTRQGMNQEAAAERVKRERAERAMRQQEAGRAKPEAEAEQRMKDDIARFMERYPGVTEVPPEVWDRVRNNGELLTDAYRDHMQQKEAAGLKAENERLKAELAALEQNQKNQRTTIGSQSTNAGSEGKDLFLAALLADD